MDLRHLRYFVAAVEEGSLQGAAQRMHVAQPALSRRIRDLEASLDCQLLLRGARGVTPTHAGASFYRDALTLLDGLDTARNRTRQMGREQDASARLGLIQTARKYAFLVEAIAAFHRDRPGAGISYMRAGSPDLAAGLRDGRLDATLLYERRMDLPGIGERLIHRERYVLALHPDHRLARVPAVSLSDLSGEPLIWLSRQDDADHHDLLAQNCRLHGMEPAIAHSAHSHEEQIDLTAVSGGACLTPASTLLSTPPGMLVFRPLPHFDMEISVSLAWRHAAQSMVAGALLDALHRAIDGHQQAVRQGHATWTVIEGHAVVRVPPEGEDRVV